MWSRDRHFFGVDMLPLILIIYRWASSGRETFMESRRLRILEEVIYGSYSISESNHTTNSLQKGIHPHNHPTVDLISDS